jgi:2-oxoglutarate ferredoxin oxidoreductase subunit gamma
MLEEIIIAGFGGQGIIFAGKVLSEAALIEGRQVACTASYGPEMRGGTANSGVIISDLPIGSLSVTSPTIVVVMNEPSMEKYNTLVRSGGMLVINESLVRSKSVRTDVQVVYVAATDLAASLGNKDVANVVIIGALLAARPVVLPATMDSALRKVLDKSHPDKLAANMRAIRLGMESAKRTNQTSHPSR